LDTALSDVPLSIALPLAPPIPLHVPVLAPLGLSISMPTRVFLSMEHVETVKTDTLAATEIGPFNSFRRLSRARAGSHRRAEIDCQTAA
jgi:hypothetical protein